MDNPNINPCCLVADNLVEIERVINNVLVDGVLKISTRLVYQCKICGRKHYTFEVPAWDLGVVTK